MNDINDDTESNLFSMKILKTILNIPILSYYCCEKVDHIADENKPNETKMNKMHKELLLLTNDNLIFISKKEEKRRFLISNIVKVSIKSNAITMHFKTPIEDHHFDCGFIIYNLNSFLQSLSSQYLTDSLLKTGQINQLKIEIEVTKEKHITTSITKMNSLIREKGLNSKRCYLMGYFFETNSNLIQDNEEKNVFKWKRDSNRKQTQFKIRVNKAKSTEILMANVNKSNFKSHAMTKLSHSLKILYSNCTEIVLISIKEIGKTENTAGSRWSAWEFVLKAKQKKSKRLNLIYTFLRRKCIPPLFETYQDFTIVLEETFIDKYEFGDVERKVKSAYGLIIQSLEPEDQEKENSVSKLFVVQKIASHLVDSDTLEYFYLSRCSRTKMPQLFLSLFRFSNDIKYRLLLIKEKYEKTDDLTNMKKKCLAFVNECQTQDNPINIENYFKQMQYCSFQDIIDNECKVIRQYLTSTSPKALSLWRNKLLNTLEFTLSETFADNLFDELISLAKKVPVSYSELTVVFNTVINFQALSIDDDLLPDVSISSIMSTLPSIKETYYSEKFLAIFIQKDILKKIQGIESDLIYYQFLNYVLEKNFSLNLFEAVHCFLMNISKNLISPSYQDELSFDNHPIKKYSSVFLGTFMNIYRSYSESVDVIIIATRCLIMISSIDPMNKREILNSDVCYYLNWYLSSFDQNLVYYSVLLFKKLTESNFDIRCLVEKHSSIIIKMINTIKGSKIQNCSFHPQTLLTVLDLFGYLLQNNQVKEFLCDYSRRKWIKYLLRIIANPKIYVGQYIEYYLMILIAVYEVLTIIVKKNTDIRLYLQTEFHLIKLIDSKCKQYMLFNKGDLNYKELLLETLMDFMKEFIGNDLTMQQYARMNGKNILDYSLQLKNNTIGKILYSY